MLRLPPALARGVGAPRAGGWGQRLVQERWDDGTMGEGSSWTSCSRKLPGVGFGVFSPPKTSFLVFGVGFSFPSPWPGAGRCCSATLNHAMPEWKSLPLTGRV